MKLSKSWPQLHFPWPFGPQILQPLGLSFRAPFVPQPVAGYIQTLDLGPKTCGEGLQKLTEKPIQNSLISKSMINSRNMSAKPPGENHIKPTILVQLEVYHVAIMMFFVTSNLQHPPSNSDCRPGTPCQPPRSYPHGTPSAPVAGDMSDMYYEYLRISLGIISITCAKM